MGAKEFKNLSRLHLSPKLKEMGWNGDGFNFYKTTNNIIQIFGIYGSWIGGTIYCETAIHFNLIPDLTGNIQPAKIRFNNCLIRERLTRNGFGSSGWKLKEKVEDNISSILQIQNSFEKFGLEFYKEFENFPKPFDSINPEDIQTKRNLKVLEKYYIHNEIYFLWLLLEINCKMKRLNVANQFSQIGLEKVNIHFQKLISNIKDDKQKLITEENWKIMKENFRIKNCV
ncbi:DUF4304 domain-containing protein [Leptospira bandrabouensis]|uniref:DUF4304 domain-containing protein n=1 Tax=Leptospira bandrabouensis TaxID=2484903 RepID=A0A6H3P2J6_9LEPT|nr:DUF4304 domain-containing protein [Leptospira bandrabouensis]TGN16850.1 DUF4304 domain-containing protein [Leptospira bandrabouensis]